MNRSDTAHRLSRELSRELEWIPLTALRKDRTKRYGSASALADDIAAYLQNKPLSAGPESLVYRAEKFLHRNRLGVFVVAAIVAAVFVAASASMYQEFEYRSNFQIRVLLASRLRQEIGYVAGRRSAIAEFDAAGVGLSRDTKELLSAIDSEAAIVLDSAVADSLDPAMAREVAGRRWGDVALLQADGLSNIRYMGQRYRTMESEVRGRLSADGQIEFGHGATPPDRLSEMVQLLRDLEKAQYASLGSQFTLASWPLLLLSAASVLLIGLHVLRPAKWVTGCVMVSAFALASLVPFYLEILFHKSGLMVLLPLVVALLGALVIAYQQIRHRHVFVVLFWTLVALLIAYLVLARLVLSYMASTLR